MIEKSELDISESWNAIAGIYLKISAGLEQKLEKEHGLSLNEYHVLQHLYNKEEMKTRLQQAAEAVGMSHSAMSRLVTRLEGANYGVLEKYICEADRRGVWIRLTDQGLQQFKLVKQTYDETVSDYFFKEDVKQELMKLNNQLIK